jgi:hypothetical protein
MLMFNRMNRSCFIPFRKFCSRIPEKNFSLKDALAKITAGNILLFGGTIALYSGHEEFKRLYSKKNGMYIYKEVFGYTMGFVFGGIAGSIMGLIWPITYGVVLYHVFDYCHEKKEEIEEETKKILEFVKSNE